MKYVVAAFLVLLAAVSPVRADMILPQPEQLIAMPAKERMDLQQQIEALPKDERQQARDQLRHEIDDMTPEQRKEMQHNWFESYRAMSADEQKAVEDQYGKWASGQGAQRP